MKLYSLYHLRILVTLLIASSLSSCIIYSRSTGVRYSDASLTPKPISSTSTTSVDVNSRGNIREVNKSIIIEDGWRVNDVRSTNGRITIEDGAVARNVTSTNGRVVIGGSNSRVTDIDTVNGRISAENGGQIDGTVEAVNGRVEFINAAIGRSIRTANGSIHLYSVTVGENVETRNGDIRLENTVVENDLIIRKRRPSGLLDFLSGSWTDQEIVIGPGTEIKGTLLASSEIDLYVHSTAKINNVIGATPVTYSGPIP